MKITVRAVQASFDITDASGNSVASYAVENATFVTDINGLLNCVSQAAMLFKQLDAEHNVTSVASAVSHGFVGLRDRSPQVQELIDAVRRYKARTNSITVELSTEQHDGYMALADALTNVTDDASAANVKVLAERAKAYIALFAADKYVTVRARLIDAIAAI